MNHINFHYHFNKTYLYYQNQLLFKYITVHFVQQLKEIQININSQFHYTADKNVDYSHHLVRY